MILLFFGGDKKSASHRAAHIPGAMEIIIYHGIPSFPAYILG